MLSASEGTGGLSGLVGGIESAEPSVLAALPAYVHWVSGARFAPLRDAPGVVTERGIGRAVTRDLAFPIVSTGTAFTATVAISALTEGGPNTPGCLAGDRNGGTKSSIDGYTCLTAGGDPRAAITFHEGLTFSFLDTRIGRRACASRCLGDLETGNTEQIAGGGGLAALG